MKYLKNDILNIFKDNINNKNFIKGIFSNPQKEAIYKKINLKPIEIKKEIFIQFECFKDNKALHKNLSLNECFDFLNEIIDNFKQILIVNTNQEIQVLQNKKGFSVKIKNTTNKILDLTHNKQKNYILQDNTPIPFLIKLGVMTETGKVTKEKFNKFRQINRYLEFIEDTLKELQEKKLIDNSMKVIDFGCGKSYLTFALYHYLKNIRNLDIEIIGLDLKEDVINHCNSIAKDLNFDKLQFLKGDIKDFHLFNNVDMIFSLHACNNATDYSILKGLELGAKAILAVPCCQSEINQKISKSSTTQLKGVLSPFGNHGILQERFSSLATDALRALSLELCGYNTKVMEFIDMEHTPKNILIKAIKTSTSEEKLIEKRKEYNRYVEFLGVSPLLDSLLENYFKK
ncbi:MULTISPECIES: class I SAM-dependent methyltransferase [Cetobacterium]|jgi:SAM-dependent methyltransferase|uniref:SAM-dependent methyltransferase n=1 Tax=Candidatus Cetobacterium colombiensis TaxID=3073100 RepID=A0ABU4W878_9FUSO|nr:SAM-dependent methyltransferase [Candidatus Cetobacterium colombiensis]MDX8335733.1 SAM-dependent methyltransferase [Candidatus Cetobacterium colombiensis]